MTDRPPRKSTVVVGIFTATILFGLAVGVLAYRAWRASEPEQVATVLANERWTGVELLVVGESLPHPYQTVIDRTGRYSVPFFLPQGKYTLIARMGGAEVFRYEFELKRREKQYITLPPEVPATRPSESR